MKACPVCGERGPTLAIVFAIGVLVGALLVVAPLAMFWPELVA